MRRTKEEDRFVVRTDRLGKPMYVCGFNLALSFKPGICLTEFIFDAVRYSEDDTKAMIEDYGDWLYASEILGVGESAAGTKADA